MASNDMKDFWDDRARENAYFFVDNRLDYRDTDVEAFWAQGETDVDGVLKAVGTELRPTDRVVEIGCGVGRLTRVLAARTAHVTAIDVSSEMLDRARQANAGLDNVEWLLGEGDSLAGVEDESADACFSHVVFQHIPDPAVTLAYVRDMGRVLRPGGWAAFQVSNKPAVHSYRRGLRERVGVLLGRRPRGQDAPQWLGSAVTIEDLRAAATDGGMDIERLEGGGTQFCMVLTRRRRRG